MAAPHISMLLFAMFLACCAAPSANAAKRVALVIGNSAYQHTPALDNPKNDAVDVAQAFQKLGFEIMTGIDLSKRGMEAILQRFARALDQADVGVFFYAGHGIQFTGRNYMVPIDAKLDNVYSVDFELIPLNLIHRTMEQATSTNILFVDACRDNPLARNLARSMGTRSAMIGRGLASMESGVGSLISFSTQPGNVALDGTGQRNSPYAHALVKHLTTARTNISDMLIRVRRDVMRTTAGKQVPWEHSALTRQFSFLGQQPQASVAATARQTAVAASQEEQLFWTSVKDSKDPDMIRAYLARYPKGAFAALADLLIKKLEKPASTLQLAAKTTKPLRAASKGEAVAVAGASDEKQNKDTGLSPEELTKSVQVELKRLGCLTGAADGIWGRQSQSAMSSYNRVAKSSLRVSKATQKALDVLVKKQGRICPKAPKATRKVQTPKVQPKKVTSVKKSVSSSSSKTRNNKEKCSAWYQCVMSGNGNPDSSDTYAACGMQPPNC